MFLHKGVLRLEITLSCLNPLRGSSYLLLPKKSITNIKNKDNFCFKWAITRALNPVEEHGERVTAKLYQQARELDWTGISFPTPCPGREFEKFEKNNYISLCVW